MKVKFIETSSAKLSSVPITNGQIIALNDIDAWYYDMGNERRIVSGQLQVDSLPSSGKSGILYVLSSSSANGVYVWDGSAFTCIATTYPTATNSVSGILSSSDHTKYEDANNKKHTHANKEILDSIEYDESTDTVNFS